MKKISYIILFVFVSGFLGVAYIWYDYVTLSNVKNVTLKPIPHLIKGEVRVGIIGESWAAGRKIDDYLIQFMKQNGVKASVLSRGHPGAKSKLVYQDLFKPKDNKFSSNEILNGQPLDMCIVLTGVNDTASYVGSEFYAYHLKLITKTLISSGITPLIIEIPEYGIEETDSRTVHGKIRRRLMRLVHDSWVLDVIPKYRRAAKTMLTNNFSHDEYIYFSFDSISTDYRQNRDLYKADLIHLNSEGNKKLAFEISKVISQWLIGTDQNGTYLTSE